MAKGFFYFIMLLMLWACAKPKKDLAFVEGVEQIEFSKNLSILKNKDHYFVTVTQPTGFDTLTYRYVIYPKGQAAPRVEADAYLEYPVNRIVCTSTSHLPIFSALAEESKLVGFPGTNYIYDPAILTRVDEGKIKDLGQKNGLNFEKLIALNPEVVMTYTMGGNLDQIKNIEKSNSKVVLNADFLEQNPLGRAEWLKLSAVLLGRAAAGDSIFSVVKQNYQNLKAKVAEREVSPTVLTGIMYGDTWYIPSGNSFGAKFIADAGGDYLWSDTEGTGSLQLSFEAVFSKGKSADFWIGVASLSSLEDFAAANQKYKLFDAYKNQKVYSYIKRVNEAGANDYLESAYMRPDLVLSDHIKILHPQLMQNVSFNYFEKLNR